MSELENVKIVQEIYTAFGKGDVPAILRVVADDVQWINAGPTEVPYAGKRNSRDQVAQFFQAINDNVIVKQFEPREFIAQKDRVIVLGSWRGESKSTGRSFESEWVMAWTLINGKVTSFRSYEDTAALLEAFRKK